MPKTPITILVAPSRLAGWSHGLLGVAVVAVLAYYSGAPLAMAGLAWLALSMGYLAFRPQCGDLRQVPEQGGRDRWYWRASAGEAYREVTLRCRYLGPWLIALQLGGVERTLWLWPDSSGRESLRRLRHWLVQHG